MSLTKIILGTRRSNARVHSAIEGLILSSSYVSVSTLIFCTTSADKLRLVVKFYNGGLYASLC